VNKTLKTALWISAGVLVVAGIAAPKVLPLLSGGKSDTAQQAATPAAAGKKDDSKRGKGGADAPLKVATYLVQTMPFAEVVNSTGTLRADEGVELQAETNGKIVAINFREGTRVRKGDLLLKLNDADLRASLSRTTYSKELAMLKEQRYSQLLSRHVVTQNDYDAALSDVNVEQANIDLYKAQIEKTEIRAPFDGVVGLRYVSTGAYVNAATRIATLQRVDKLKIDFAIPEKYVGRVKVGAPVSFNISGGERQFTGQIYAIDPRIDSATRTLVLRAECANPDNRLLPGAFAEIQLKLEQIDNAILIPSEAVIPGLEEKNVFVMKDGKAVRRPVETGTRTASTVHVIAGLKPGDVLITSGLQQLRPGQPVSPADPPETRSADHAVEKKGEHRKHQEETTDLAGPSSLSRPSRKTDKS
jgi:membrane fusion protein (multidrug efflux system)